MSSSCGRAFNVSKSKKSKDIRKERGEGEGAGSSPSGYNLLHYK